MLFYDKVSHYLAITMKWYCCHTSAPKTAVRLEFHLMAKLSYIRTKDSCPSGISPHGEIPCPKYCYHTSLYDNYFLL